jgi:hypothetical protein
MTKQQKTVHWEEETVDMIEAGVNEASDMDIVAEISFSMLSEHILQLGLEEWDGTVRDAIPEEIIEKFEIRYNKKRRKAEDYKNKMAGYWRKNVQRELTKFYDDEVPTRPANVRLSMEKWREEAKEVYEDKQALEEDLAWLDRKLDEYEESVESSSNVPNQGLERVSDEIEVGREIGRLIEQGESFLTDIAQLCESAAHDPDAIIDKVAGDYAVSTEAVEEALDMVISEESDTRRVLKGADSAEILRVVDRDALGGSNDLSDLPEPEEAEEVITEVEEADTSDETDELGEVDTSDETEASEESETSEEPEEIEIPTEPTEDMIEVAVEKYRVTGSVETTRTGLENADHVECTVAQAEQAAEIAEQRVESGEAEETDTSEEPETADAQLTDGAGEVDTSDETETLGVPEGYDPTEEVEPPENVVDKAESLLRSGDSMAEIYNAVRKHVTSDDVCEAVIEEAQARLDGDGAEEISVDTEASTESTQAATDGGDLNE